MDSFPFIESDAMKSPTILKSDYGLHERIVNALGQHLLDTYNALMFTFSLNAIYMVFIKKFVSLLRWMCEWDSTTNVLDHS